MSVKQTGHWLQYSSAVCKSHPWPDITARTWEVHTVGTHHVSLLLTYSTTSISFSSSGGSGTSWLAVNRISITPVLSTSSMTFSTAVSHTQTPAIKTARSFTNLYYSRNERYTSLYGAWESLTPQPPRTFAHWTQTVSPRCVGSEAEIGHESDPFMGLGPVHSS